MDMENVLIQVNVDNVDTHDWFQLLEQALLDGSVECGALPPIVLEVTRAGALELGEMVLLCSAPSPPPPVDMYALMASAEWQLAAQCSPEALARALMSALIDAGWTLAHLQSGVRQGGCGPIGGGYTITLEPGWVRVTQFAGHACSQKWDASWLYMDVLRGHSALQQPAQLSPSPLLAPPPGLRPPARMPDPTPVATTPTGAMDTARSTAAEVRWEPPRRDSMYQTDYCEWCCRPYTARLDRSSACYVIGCQTCETVVERVAYADLVIEVDQGKGNRARRVRWLIERVGGVYEGPDPDADEEEEDEDEAAPF